MAFHAFNFGKQLGIVGGGATNKLPDIQGSSSRPLYPWEINTADSPTYGPGYVDPWVHRQYLELLRQIMEGGGGEGNRGGGDLPGGSGYGGGASSTGSGGERRNAPSVTIGNKQMYDALVEWKNRVDNIRANLDFDYYCRPTTGTDPYDPDCCSVEERDLVALTFEKIFEVIGKERPELANCLREKLKGLKMSCPDDSFFFNTDSVYEDPEFKKWFYNASNNGTINIPDGMIDLQDGVYLLSSIIELCNPNPDQYGMTVAAFALLGVTPTCDDIKSYVNASLKQKGMTWDEFKKGTAGIFWGDNFHGYDPKSGNVYSFKDEKAGKVVARWPKYTDCID